MNKRKNIKVIVMLLIITLLMLIAGTVNAKTYNIIENNMSIKLEDDYIDMFTEYYDNEEKFSEVLPSEYYSNFVNANKAQGVVLDAIKINEENEMLTEVLISIPDSGEQNQIRDLKDYSKDKMQEYAKIFVDSLKTELESNGTNAEVSQDEIFIADNGDVYIKVHSVLQGLDSDIFYTIKNYKLIGINIRYMDGNQDLEMAKQIINQVTINDATIYKDDVYYYSQLISSVIFCIILIGITINIRKSNKKEEAKQEITEEQKQKYKKMGGFLLFYIVIVILNIILQAVNIYIYLLNAEVLTNIIAAIQTMASIIIVICILINIFRRNSKTPQRIKKLLYIMLAINIILCLAEIAYSFIDTVGMYSNQYYLTNIAGIFSNISYTLIWSTYFTVSKRVQEYYQDKE